MMRNDNLWCVNKARGIRAEQPITKCIPWDAALEIAKSIG
jgi:hypothetical protein